MTIIEPSPCHRGVEVHHDQWGYWIECDRCGRVAPGHTVEDAVEEWNAECE